MKNIYKKINISYTLLLLLFISLLSGLFREILSFIFVLIIHEIGHIISSFYYGWNIDSIKFGACGGYITYDQPFEKPYKEEFIIAISGFIMQAVLFIAVSFLYKMHIIDPKLTYLITKYNVSIFLFNIIPVIPLDGSKVLLILLNKLFPHKKSLYVLTSISTIVCILMIILIINLNVKIEYSYIIISIFIIKNTYKYYMLIPYIQFRFLFERYMYGIKTNKYKTINGGDLNKMYKNKKHIFVINDKKYQESLILSKKFDYFNNVW